MKLVDQIKAEAGCGRLKARRAAMMMAIADRGGDRETAMRLTKLKLRTVRNYERRFGFGFHG
jgi:hypothetical protein